MYVHMYIHASCISSQAFFQRELFPIFGLAGVSTIYIYRQYMYIYIYVYMYVYTYLWKTARHSKFGLDRVFTTPRCAIFPISGLAEVFATSKLSFFFIFGLADVVITPELSIFYIFGRAKVFIPPKLSIFPNVWTCRSFHNILTYIYIYMDNCEAF